MFTVAFAIALLGAGAFYAGVLAAFGVGVRRVLRQADPPPTVPPTALPLVSVLIPARDEAATLRACLDGVMASTYPTDRFEVIVIDDLSLDGTCEVVRTAQAHYNRDGDRLHLLRMPENLERTRAHKKRAIEKGIAAAQGSVILTTDADCAVPPTWIAEMTAPLVHDPSVAFVSGPVLFRHGASWWTQVQALEFLGLVACGAGCIGLHRPTICNGANVAYRKAVFASLGGFHGIDHLTSGDDELLMQKIAYTTPHRVAFRATPAAAVVTDAVPTLQAFLNQRTRWASKGAHYPSKRLVALLVAIYLFFVFLLVGLLAWPWVPAVAAPLVLALSAKVAAEAWVLGPFLALFNRRSLLRYFLLTELLHIPYIVYVAARGAWGQYEWKGRKIER